MVDMAYTPEELAEKQKMMDGTPSIENMEKYPWGTRLRFDNATVKKLGLNPQIGQEVKFMAVAKVVEVEATEEVDGDVRQHVALQITTMELEKGTDRAAQATALFGGNDNATS